jgi:hypothetical protein
MNTNPDIRGYAYGMCRLLGHAWHHVPSDWKPEFGEPMTVRCERCDMERRDSVERGTGYVLSRRYTYPLGYQFTDREADDRPSRATFRASWLDDELSKAREARRNRSAS